MKKLNYIVFDIVVNNLTKVVGIAMLCVICLQIFARMFMSTPFSWTEELSRFTFIWYCFLGCAVTLKAKEHLGLDYFYRKFKPGFARWVDILIQVLTFAFGVLCTFPGIRLLPITAKRLSPVMRIPMNYIYVCIPVMGLLFMLISVENMIGLLKNSDGEEKSL